jgi:hypothetical protein
MSIFTMGLTRTPCAGLALLFAVAGASVVQAQRPVTSPRRADIRSDTVQHSPFIPGGHWRPGPPEPVPEAVADLPPVTPTAVTDSAGYFARPNGMLMHPDTTTFALELRRDTSLVPLGVRTVTVSESMTGGVPDWLVAESRTGTAIATYDSLHLRRADLTPTRWTARNGVSQLAVSFTNDSMFAALQDYQGRGSFAAGIPPGALITPAMVDRLLALVPLSSGYRSGASLVNIEEAGPQAVPATITVEGEQQVMLGAQPVECWLIVLRTPTTEKRYWVQKSPQRVVKTERSVGNGTLTELLQLPLPQPPATPVTAPSAAPMTTPAPGAPTRP